ncbi:Amine oxidase [flavin-containing] A [Bagarius yarrelli]|uniref:monoamine oxidase n=1 Tax=Bagarius yarrelli TaxID=175774 RepID=A0A556V9Q9_BAGYA|nr:Amine oxidase [flavin-containing] A [Bagarius yarrelli]
MTHQRNRNPGLITTFLMVSKMRLLGNWSLQETVHAEGPEHFRRFRLITYYILTPAQIQYRPALPMERQRLAQCMPVGHMTKFIITYPTAFWKQKGFSGEIVAHPSKSCPFGVTFDATSSSGSPALVGFIAGVQACYWNNREMEDRRHAVVSSLVKYLGLEAASYIHYEEKALTLKSLKLLRLVNQKPSEKRRLKCQKDWAQEEYNGGCPVNIMVPGMLTFYHPGLRKPCGRIYWAGTETATQWCGYLSGAVQSGQRAALEVLADVSPDVLSHGELQEVRGDIIKAPSDLSRVWDHTGGFTTSSRLLKSLTIMAVAVGGAMFLRKAGLGKKLSQSFFLVVIQK